MQTLTESQIQQNAKLLFTDLSNEPFLLKDDQNHTSLVLPSGKWQDAFLLFYNTLNKTGEQNLTNFNKVPAKKKNLISPTSFFKKWHGSIKTSEDYNWKDDYLDYLNEKYK